VTFDESENSIIEAALSRKRQRTWVVMQSHL